MSEITFVKKIKADGSPCRKCAEVEARLDGAGLMSRIARTIIADERDPSSEGMRLARDLGIDAAPFFVVTEGEERTVYTSYVRLLKEVLVAPTTPEEEAREILENSDDLDYV
jgi:hypothetical protein